MDRPDSLDCSACGRLWEDCVCPHDWDEQGRTAYQDLGYRHSWLVRCRRCGVNRQDPLPAGVRHPLPAMGPYHPWDGVSTCGQVKLQALSASQRSRADREARLAEEAEARKSIPEGYHWVRFREDKVQPRLPFVMWFNREHCFFCPVPGEGWEDAVSWKALEVLAPCPVPPEVQSVVDAEKVLSS